MVSLIRAFHAVLSVCYFVPANPFAFDQMNDNPCYDKKTSKPVYCDTEFINPIVTYKLPIKVTESCDRSPRMCRRGEGKRRTMCGSCRRRNQHSYSPSYLTDLHNPRNVTCWKSKPFPTVDNQTGFYRNITLTLSLKKRYQLYYFSIEFCTMPPETMIIYKSKDHRKNWIPYQFNSSSCRSMFNKNPGLPNDHPAALCTQEYNNLSDAIIINISPNSSGKDTTDLTDKEYEWASVTDIKIVIMNPYFIHKKHSVGSYKPVDRSSLQFGPLSRLTSGMFSREIKTTNKAIRSSKHPKEIKMSPVIYGISDISMGGRCQCNGHASVCNMVGGKPICQCYHNTAGPDCGRCKPFHDDRPWMRATKNNAHACVACKCNIHAKRCRFDMTLYKLSGNDSGGICVNCRHNTAGRYCHYCKEGYYRNPNKPMIHRRACLPCDCDILGSAGTVCNRTTGQCPCKDHAVGRQCQSCSSGYEQTGNFVQPCGKKAEKQEEKTIVCPRKCELPARKQIKKKRFCRRNTAFEALVISASVEGEWVKYRIDVKRIIKKSNRNFRKGEQMLIVKLAYIQRCKCSKLKLSSGRKYLIFSSHNKPLILEPNDSVVTWRDSYKPMLNRYSKPKKKC